MAPTTPRSPLNPTTAFADAELWDSVAEGVVLVAVCEAVWPTEIELDTGVTVIPDEFEQAMLLAMVVLFDSVRSAH